MNPSSKKSERTIAKADSQQLSLLKIGYDTCKEKICQNKKDRRKINNLEQK
jgi:hypothetical protein